MKKAIFLGTVVAAMTASSLFADPTVTTVGNGGTYDGYGPYQTGSGGEFTLYSPDLATDISYYYSGAKNQVPGSTPNFQTFCVEGNEYIYGNSLSYVTFSGQSIYTDDPLSKGAAYLYSQFATGGNFGGLATYSYAPAGRSASAALLQNAIWALMGGQEGQTAANNASNPFMIAAEAQFGGTCGLKTARLARNPRRLRNRIS